MAVSKRLRYEVLRRDNNTCRYCHAIDTPLQIDHVIPVTLGGSDDPANLVAACKDCNAGKSSAPTDGALIADVADDAIRWARAMKAAAQEAQADRDVRYRAAEAVCEQWGLEMSPWAYKPDDWERSVNGFVAAGLTTADLLEAVSIAAAKYGLPNADRWRYFCGVANVMIRDRQEAARALLAAQEPIKRPAYASERAYAQDTYFTLSNFCDGAILQAAGVL